MHLVGQKAINDFKLHDEGLCDVKCGNAWPFSKIKRKPNWEDSVSVKSQIQENK